MGSPFRRFLLRPLIGAGLLLLAVVPVAAAEGGHAHCEASVEDGHEIVQPVVTVTHATIGAAEAPCGDCPDTHCATHLPCSVNSAPALAGQAAVEATVVAPRETHQRSRMVPPVLDDPTPPTPPPNGLSVH